VIPEIHLAVGRHGPRLFPRWVLFRHRRHASVCHNKPRYDNQATPSGPAREIPKKLFSDRSVYGSAQVSCRSISEVGFQKFDLQLNALAPALRWGAGALIATLCSWPTSGPRYCACLRRCYGSVHLSFPHTPSLPLAPASPEQFNKGVVHKCLNCKKKGGFRKAIFLTRIGKGLGTHER
jgi:hypothetical protein